MLEEGSTEGMDVTGARLGEDVEGTAEGCSEGFADGAIDRLGSEVGVSTFRIAYIDPDWHRIWSKHIM